MKTVSFSVKQETADRLRALVALSGVSAGEHMRRAVTAEVCRAARFLPAIGIFPRIHTVKFSVALPSQTVQLLQAWKHQTVSDHLRRALEVYLPEAEIQFGYECYVLNRWLKIPYPEHLEHVRSAVLERAATVSAAKQHEPAKIPEPFNVTPAFDPAAMRAEIAKWRPDRVPPDANEPRAPTPPRTKHPLAPGQVQGKHGPVTVPADPENPAAAADAIRQQLGAPDPARWDAKYRAKQ